MKVYAIYDKEFNEYGCKLEEYDFSELMTELKKLKIPKEGIIYDASVTSLENCGEKKSIESRGFGGMPIQIGYVEEIIKF